MIRISAPGKIHLLGEHAVVYGKPALLTAINLRVTVSISPANHSSGNKRLKRIIEQIIRNKLKLKKIPPYKLEISSQIPIGSGLGSSAAISAAYIAALLSFLKVKWDLNLINDLTFEAEKVFHGNPSGADNTTVVYGGLISYIKGKSIQQFPFSISKKLAKNFILINTGKPKETTKEMVEMVSVKFNPPVGGQSAKFKKIFDHQEQLTRELLPAIKEDNEKELMRIIREGEKNLENLGVVSPFVQSIIREIEQADGAAKICGAGGKTGPAGVLLCYHPNPSMIQNIAKSKHLDYFRIALGVQGLRQE